MLFSKLITLVAWMVPALAIVWFQHHSVVQQQAGNARIRDSIKSIEQELDVFESIKPGIRISPSTQPIASSTQSLKGSAAADKNSPKAAAASVNVPYVALSKTNLKHLALTPVDEDFKLTDEACAVLGISPTERTALNKATTGLITKQQQLDLARVQAIEDHLTTEAGRKTTFKIPAYAEEGRVLAEEFLAETQAVIGAERTELLLGYADLNTISSEGYEPFGRTEKTITYLDLENPDGTRGDCKIFMRIVDTVSGFTLSTSFANLDDSTPKAWRHLIQNTAPTQP